MTKDEALVKYNEIDRRTGIRPFWEVRDIIENLCSQIEELQNRSCENCKHQNEGSSRFFCSKINISFDIGGCGDYWEIIDEK